MNEIKSQEGREEKKQEVGYYGTVADLRELCIAQRISNNHQIVENI